MNLPAVSIAALLGIAFFAATVRTFAQEVPAAVPPAAAEQADDAGAEEDMDEITVFGGRSLGSYRQEVLRLEDRMHEVFNSLVGDEDYHIHCTMETRTGTNISRRVCRPRFVDRLHAEKGRDEVAVLQGSAYGGVGDVKVAEARYRAEIFRDTMYRLATESPEFLQAIADYEAAREREREARRERCAGRIICR